MYMYMIVCVKMEYDGTIFIIDERALSRLVVKRFHRLVFG